MGAWWGTSGWQLMWQPKLLVQGREGAEGAHGDAARRVAAVPRVVGQDWG